MRLFVFVVMLVAGLFVAPNMAFAQGPVEETWEGHISRTDSRHLRVFEAPENAVEVTVIANWRWGGSPNQDQKNEAHKVSFNGNEIKCKDFGNEELEGQTIPCGSKTFDWSSDLPVLVEFDGDNSSPGSHGFYNMVIWKIEEPTPVPSWAKVVSSCDGYSISGQNANVSALFEVDHEGDDFNVNSSGSYSNDPSSFFKPWNVELLGNTVVGITASAVNLDGESIEVVVEEFDGTCSEPSTTPTPTVTPTPTITQTTTSTPTVTTTPTPTPTPTTVTITEVEGQNYRAPWRISEDSEKYESEQSRQGNGYAPYYGAGSGKDLLPSYDNNGLDGRESVCNAAGDCLQATDPLTDVTKAFKINANVVYATERNDVAEVLYEREVRPISKDGKIVAVVLGPVNKVSEGSTDGSSGPYSMYRGLQASDNTLMVFENAGQDISLALDIAEPGTHGIVGISWGTHAARHSIVIDKCNGDDYCEMAERQQAALDTMFAAQVAWDKSVFGRLVGSYDGFKYFGRDIIDENGNVHHRSVESLFAEMGYAYHISDENNRIPLWVSQMPVGTILPVGAGGRGDAMHICTLVESNGDVIWNENCTRETLIKFASEFPNNRFDLNPQDYRGPWGISSPADPSKLALYGVSEEYYFQIAGNPEKLNELADLIPSDLFHTVEVPFEFDVNGESPIVEPVGGSGPYGLTIENPNGFELVGEIRHEDGKAIAVEVPANGQLHWDRIPGEWLNVGHHEVKFVWQGAGNEGTLDMSFNICNAGNFRGHDLGFTCFVDASHPDAGW